MTLLYPLKSVSRYFFFMGSPAITRRIEKALPGENSGWRKLLGHLISKEGYYDVLYSFIFYFISIFFRSRPLGIFLSIAEF